MLYFVLGSKPISAQVKAQQQQAHTGLHSPANPTPNGWAFLHEAHLHACSSPMQSMQHVHFWLPTHQHALHLAMQHSRNRFSPFTKLHGHHQSSASSTLNTEYHHPDSPQIPPYDAKFQEAKIVQLMPRFFKKRAFIHRMVMHPETFLIVLDRLIGRKVTWGLCMGF